MITKWLQNCCILIRLNPNCYLEKKTNERSTWNKFKISLSLSGKAQICLCFRSRNTRRLVEIHKENLQTRCSKKTLELHNMESSKIWWNFLLKRKTQKDLELKEGKFSKYELETQRPSESLGEENTVISTTYMEVATKMEKFQKP